MSWPDILFTRISAPKTGNLDSTFEGDRRENNEL